ncbi:MAG: NADH-ubiquinone oxidoreductase-F iron-sulfur binding region domain-containing protein [Jatrophihabitantaceae bacterium]
MNSTGYRPFELLAEPPAEVRAGLLQARPVTFGQYSPVPSTSLAGHDLPAHAACFGNRWPLDEPAAERLLHDLDRSYLTGRGGGHFPVSVKAQSALRAGPGGVLVANGSESEPASAKDHALLWLRPHLVLDGLAAMAELIEATDAVLWLHEGDPDLLDVLTRALAERRRAGLDRIVPQLALAPQHYLSGESSAIVRSLAGGPTLPAFTRVPASSSGVHGRPTLVHNVETLARIALIQRYGSAAPDSTLYTVIAEGNRQVVEADQRWTVAELIGSVTGRSAGYQAVLVGGYGGRWMRWSAVAGVGASHAAMAAHGINSGAGVLLPIRSDECGLWQASQIASYLAESSARQCGPCLFGLRAVADILDELVEGAARERDLSRLQRYRAEIAGRGACRHPDGALGMVASAMDVFADDVDEHLRLGSCRRMRSGGLPGLA